MRVEAAASQRRNGRAGRIAGAAHADQQQARPVEHPLQVPVAVGGDDPLQRLRLVQDVGQEPLAVHCARTPISHRIPPIAAYVHSGRNVAA